MKKKGNNSNKIELSLNEKQGIINVINPLSQDGTYRVQSDLSMAKGKIGVLVYFLRDDLNRAFAPLDEKATDLHGQAKELLEKLQAMEAEAKGDMSQEQWIGSSKSEKLYNSKEYSDINTQITDLNSEFKELMSHKEKVTLRKGKLPEQALDYLNADEIIILEKVVNLA